MRTSLGKSSFSFDSRVATQLGRESISSSLVAIIELVKNSYDADAENVNIKLIQRKGNKYLVIEDDGNGMSLSDIKEKWLRIGTDNKSQNDVSLFKKRVLTGAKGLGRLGLDRLCKRFLLQTSTKNCNSITELYINWKKYEKTGRDISSIDNEMSGISKPIDDVFGVFPLKHKPCGSRLVLFGLKDDWNIDFLKRLKKELQLLVSPFDTDKSFSVTIDTSQSSIQFDGKIDSEAILDAAEAILIAKITNEYKTSISISFPDDPDWDKSFNDQDWTDQVYEKAYCGPLELKLYFMPAKSENLDKITNDFSIENKDYKSFVRNNQGIRIYRDKFRVKPYGDPSGEGDWLNLALRRVQNPQGVSQTGWKIGYNQIVGAVFISRISNPELNDQTNREGLTEERGYFSLKSFSIKAIQLFEQQIHERAKAKRLLEIDKSESLKTDIDNAQKALDHGIYELKKSFNEPVKDAKKIDNIIKGIESNIKVNEYKQSEIRKVLEQRNKVLEYEKNTLSNLASIGILSVAFGHETLQATTTTHASAIFLQKSFAESNIISDDKVRDSVKKKINYIVKNVEFIQSFSKFSLENIKRDKRKTKNINPKEIMEYVKSNFQESLFKKRIQLEIISNVNEGFFIKGYVIDWESIFINLLTNSMWAMEDTDANERKIMVSFNIIKNNTLEITYSDNGKGIDEKDESFIFNAMYSTKTNSSGEIIGTGMGLSITKSFIENNSKGRIFINKNNILKGASFLITLPLVK